MKTSNWLSFREEKQNKNNNKKQAKKQTNKQKKQQANKLNLTSLFRKLRGNDLRKFLNKGKQCVTVT